ncbi:hypothetical protein F442_22252 [Phytophthora nicotianae P10297]|uniref:Uncharacterized protein n=2 Tax=Phytophthora nicotianae TaxID=4792 RepID=W2Y021_PHYNI|nr:hypothetical protein F442_22252 [Phytophthora nicotianae P10297]KUF81833.1 hypothetical protein AM587_10002161 [Phytophthora nicotianae]KUF82221.1 12-oxophytodienoate reductase 1 [Phytophthora nicotianae]
MPPPKKHSATSATTPKPATTPTAITVVSDTSPSTKHEHVGKHMAYESPLKKLKKTMSQHKRQLFTTIDELREFIQINDTSLPAHCGSVRIQARLLWFEPQTVAGTRVLRLYLGEQQDPEPFEQQRQEYQKAQREDEFETNQFLITLSLYEIAPDHPALPSPGSVIAFNPTKLKLYRNCCQVRATLSGITTVIEP